MRVRSFVGIGLRHLPGKLPHLETREASKQTTPIRQLLRRKDNKAKPCNAWSLLVLLDCSIVEFPVGIVCWYSSKLFAVEECINGNAVSSIGRNFHWPPTVDAMDRVHVKGDERTEGAEKQVTTIKEATKK